jgi:hypothetical protein
MIWCKILGHKWIYIDINQTLDSFSSFRLIYNEKRICHRCNSVEKHIYDIDHHCDVCWQPVNMDLEDVRDLKIKKLLNE